MGNCPFCLKIIVSHSQTKTYLPTSTLGGKKNQFTNSTEQSQRYLNHHKTVSSRKGDGHRTKQEKGRLAKAKATPSQEFSQSPHLSLLGLKCFLLCLELLLQHWGRAAIHWHSVPCFIQFGLQGRDLDQVIVLLLLQCLFILKNDFLMVDFIADSIQTYLTTLMLLKHFMDTDTPGTR